jgi:iron complex transport system permease protein
MAASHAADPNTLYGRLTAHRRLVLLVLLLALLPAALLSLKIGSYPISSSTIISTLLFGSEDSLISHLIFNIRLPRTLAALLAGAGLALSGSVMQTLLKNPLAAPSTLGVSQGAAFGAAVAIILLGSGQTFTVGNEGVLLGNRSLTALCAFAGASLSTLAILAIATSRRLAAEAMILAGVAMGAFLSACTMLLQYFASDLQVAATLFWTFGDLGKAGWQENQTMALLLAVVLGGCIWKGWSLNALQWGDETAHSLGVSPAQLRLTGMLLTCLLVSIITAFLGIIAFVGLMAPHLIRPFIGSDQRYLLPGAALCGALLLLAADIVSRTVLAPVVIPVGIITSFAGAPLFLALLLRRRPPC